jgi:serine/threonine protein kinase
MDHPNIVKGYGIGEIEVEIGRKQPFIVMEYIPNHLGQLRHFRSIKEGLTVARGIIRGLGYAWTGHQTLHRDIKPQNVLLKLSSNQELALDDVKVADFGISKKVDKTSPDTATALFAIKGTISYLWPEEIVISGLSAEAKTTKYEEEGPGRDIYATGILLYEKYFGSLPPERTFRKPDEDPKNEKVQKEIVKRYYAFARAALNLEGDKDRYELKKPDSTFPEPVWQLIKKATAMDPALRYQNSAEFEAALDQIETELAGMEESASPLAAENPASFYASLVKKLIEISVSQDSPLTTPEMRSYLKQMNAYYQQDPTNDAIGGLNGYVKTRFLGMPVKAGQ